jgi:o-succinylbenzoate synthase
MSSEIIAVNTYIVEVPLTNQWSISLYSANTRRHAIVEVVTEDGIRGYGEASPSPAFMGETADTIKLVVDSYLNPAVIGLNVNELATIHKKMNDVIYSNSAAKSAIDIAVHDAWGKTLQTPVYQLIGGEYRKKIPLAYVVGIKNNHDAYEEALKRIEQGFEVVKVKVGKDEKRDIELVNLIRKAITDSGKDVKLRLDANQGYDVPTAIKVIQTLESSGELEAIEQPTKKWNLLGLKEIRTKVNTPIMIDETVFGPEDAMTAIKLEIADIINLKICKVGGLYQAKKIAALAESAGMSCTVGSNLELGIGIAASLHFVASTPVVKHPSDFICGVYLHDYDLLENSIEEIVEGGIANLTAGPGLGIRINKELLQERHSS